MPFEDLNALIPQDSTAGGGPLESALSRARYGYFEEDSLQDRLAYIANRIETARARAAELLSAFELGKQGLAGHFKLSLRLCCDWLTAFAATLDLAALLYVAWWLWQQVELTEENAVLPAAAGVVTLFAIALQLLQDSEGRSRSRLRLLHGTESRSGCLATTIALLVGSGVSAWLASIEFHEKELSAVLGVGWALLTSGAFTGVSALPLLAAAVKPSAMPPDASAREEEKLRLYVAAYPPIAWISSPVEDLSTLPPQVAEAALEIRKHCADVRFLEESSGAERDRPGAYSDRYLIARRAIGDERFEEFVVAAWNKDDVRLIRLPS